MCCVYTLVATSAFLPMAFPTLQDVHTHTHIHTHTHSHHNITSSGCPNTTPNSPTLYSRCRRLEQPLNSWFSRRAPRGQLHTLARPGGCMRVTENAGEVQQTSLCVCVCELKVVFGTNSHKRQTQAQTEKVIGGNTCERSGRVMLQGAQGWSCGTHTLLLV